jgi:hypothetical protein
MANEKKKETKKKFDGKRLLKVIKDETALIPDGAEYRGARKALVIAYNQLNTAITK